MKDLYTFDENVDKALETYDAVRNAYRRIFDQLKIPYLIAAADSGNMGGSLSHEFHFSSSKGEDTVITCSCCDAVYNEEVADGKGNDAKSDSNFPGISSGLDIDGSMVGGSQVASTGMWLSISKDRKTLVRTWYPKFAMPNEEEEPIKREVNSHAVKSIAKAADIDLDLSVDNPQEQWTHHHVNSQTALVPAVLDIYDQQVRVYKRPPLGDLGDEFEYSMIDRFPGTNHMLNIVKAHDGDACVKCGQGMVKTHTAVELGHTFHLGTRYSEVLRALVAVRKPPANTSNDEQPTAGTVPMQMGCHGIGVSRMLAAVADKLADSRGLNWPKAIAPYEVVIAPVLGAEADAEMVYDRLSSSIDVIIDDRDKPMGWKLGDADMIGYPVIVVLGRKWKKQGLVEVQCRRLDNLKERIPLDHISSFVESLLNRL